MNDDVWGGSMEMKEDVIVDRSRAGLKREVEAVSNDTEFGSQKELNLLQKESWIPNVELESKGTQKLWGME